MDVHHRHVLQDRLGRLHEGAGGMGLWYVGVGLEGWDFGM